MFKLVIVFFSSWSEFHLLLLLAIWVGRGDCFELSVFTSLLVLSIACFTIFASFCIPSSISIIHATSCSPLLSSSILLISLSSIGLNMHCSTFLFLIFCSKVSKSNLISVFRFVNKGTFSTLKLAESMNLFLTDSKSFSKSSIPLSALLISVFELYIHFLSVVLFVLMYFEIYFWYPSIKCVHCWYLFTIGTNWFVPSLTIAKSPSIFLRFL